MVTWNSPITFQMNATTDKVAWGNSAPTKVAGDDDYMTSSGVPAIT